MKTKMSLALLTLLLAAGCAENDQINLPDITPVNAVPINLGQQVTALTRAAATDGVQVSATILMCDGAEGATAVDWTKFNKVDKNVINTDTKQLESRASVSAASFTVSESPASDISLNQLLYYSMNDKIPSFIAGVSPSGKVSDTGVTVEFNQKDGTQDVMYAPTVAVGTAADENNVAGTAKYNLAFTHLTTQLNFAVAYKAVTGGGEWQGKRVALKSIAVNNAAVPQSINVANGVVSWSSLTTIKVPGITEAAMSATPIEVGEAFMINPYTEVTLNIVITVDGAEKLFNNIRVFASEMKELVREVGKSHKITLTVNEPANAESAVTIQTTATVAPWVQGASGSAEI